MEPITWKQQNPEYRQVITKGELLRDIKTNIISLLHDYKGRGIENEDFYIAEVEKMFTGGVVPSLVDWKILNAVLLELSEVKEQGEMYRYFIRDVSDSLGVSDLEKIRDFIEYITTLAPIEPEVEMVLDEFPRYSIHDFYATFKYNINQPNKTNQATTFWQVREPQGTPYAHVTLYDSNSEDVDRYEVTFSAGRYEKTFTFDGIEMGSVQVAVVNIPISWGEWFGTEIRNLTFNIKVDAIDKRENVSTVSRDVIYPASDGLPQGFETFQIHYLPTANQGWRGLSGSIYANDRSFGPINMLDVDGKHRFRIRGRDPGVGWSPWVLSPEYDLLFRGDPPGKPSPKVTTTINSATVTWKATANTDYYEVYRGNNQSMRRVNAGATLKTTFTGLSQNTNYTFYVRAVNEWDTNTGSTTGKTKRIVKKTISWNGLRHKTWNGQAYYNNKAGYRLRYSHRNAAQDKPLWKKTYNRTSGSMFQGHWRETSWGLGYAMRSGGYRAWDGQSHGNNATFIEMDYRGMRNRLRGKKITKVEIRLQREGSPHGWANKGQPVYLYNHNSEFTPPDPVAIFNWNRQRISNSNNPATVSLNFSRGAKHTFSNTNAKKLVQNIVDGHMKGFAFIKYYGGAFNNTANVPRGSTHYIRFVPSYFNVKVHYEDIV